MYIPHTHITNANKQHNSPQIYPEHNSYISHTFIYHTHTHNYTYTHPNTHIHTHIYWSHFTLPFNIGNDHTNWKSPSNFISTNIWRHLILLLISLMLKITAEEKIDLILGYLSFTGRGGTLWLVIN